LFAVNPNNPNFSSDRIDGENRDHLHLNICFFARLVSNSSVNRTSCFDFPSINMWK
jgi:hypothetical protein